MKNSAKKLTALAGALTAATLVLAGCSSSDTTAQSVDSTEAPQTVPGQVALVDAAGFEAAIADSDTTIIDVRTQTEFDQGHIEGAKLLSIEGPDFTSQIAALDPEQTYAVYCRSGNRSAAATKYMLDQGFTSVYELADGINSWTGAGLPIVQ